MSSVILAQRADDLYYGNVEYYEFNKKTKRNIKDPKDICLLKHSNYSNQNEFRMFFAIDNEFKLKQTITIKGNPFNLAEDKNPKPDSSSKEIIVNIGNIEPLTEVFYKK